MDHSIPVIEDERTPLAAVCFRRGLGRLRQTAPLLLVLGCGALACQAQSLEGITTVTTNFLTWFRAFLGIVGVIAIVWGGAKIMFSGDIGRGLSGVFAGIVGLFIAGYAQQIVNLFYSTSS